MNKQEQVERLIKIEGRVDNLEHRTNTTRNLVDILFDKIDNIPSVIKSALDEKFKEHDKFNEKIVEVKKEREQERENEFELIKAKISKFEKYENMGVGMMILFGFLATAFVSMVQMVAKLIFSG